MAVFLFVIAAVALLAGLVGLVAGSMPGAVGCKKDPRVSVASWSSRGDERGRLRLGGGPHVKRR
jgi:hypothetical protein